jgi:ABC-2 type transport system ATP-binding protein
MSLITLKNVTKVFGNTKAVDDVSFSVEPGKIYGILGPNGAGKTTTIRMINHIMIPDSGEIRVNDQLVSPLTQHMIGYMPEERGLYKKMKVGEQLMYLAQLKGMNASSAKKALKYWLDRFEASDWLKKEIGELSKGMQQKIQFIATIVHNPDIYIFDEPFSGLDPINSELLKEVILELKGNGKTILFSTHRMEQVEQMCDDICLYNNGKKMLDGNLSTIKKSFGRNTVIMEFEGEGAFLDKIDGVRFNNRSTRFVEMVLGSKSDPKDILELAIQHVSIIKFELVYPSLQEIFIKTVKQDSNQKVAV